MRIYKWVPVNCNGNEQSKKLKQIDSSQSSMNDKENSKITRTDEDSNTCEFVAKIILILRGKSNALLFLGFSFSEIQFQNSSDKFLFSEDSNQDSQSSDTIPAKKFKSND